VTAPRTVKTIRFLTEENKVVALDPMERVCLLGRSVNPDATFDHDEEILACQVRDEEIVNYCGALLFCEPTPPLRLAFSDTWRPYKPGPKKTKREPTEKELAEAVVRERIRLRRERGFKHADAAPLPWFAAKLDPSILRDPLFDDRAEKQFHRGNVDYLARTPGPTGCRCDICSGVGARR
jgi:hypothetical protein